MPKMDSSASSNRMIGWLLSYLRVAERRQPVLTVLERVALAPRQSLALVEAKGRTILVATSPECSPTFFALDRTDEWEGGTQSERSPNAVPVRGIVC